MNKCFHHPLFHSMLILLLGILAYSNSFGVPFVLDDVESISTNQVIQSLKNFLPGGTAYDFLPRRVVGYFSLALNFHFGGLDVFGYHLFNLGIHLGAALLAYALVRLTFRTPGMTGSSLASQSGTVALLAALLFLVHPIQTQAVTYTIQRLASLCTLFYLLALVLYVTARLKSIQLKQRARKVIGPGFLLFAGSFAAALLAMLTKEIAFTLPIVALLFEMVFFEGRWHKRILYLLPLLVTLPLIPCHILFAESGDSPGSLDIERQLQFSTDLPRSHYLFTQFRVVVTYLRLLILPVEQNLDYDYPVFTSFAHPQVFLSFLFLTTLLVSGIGLIRKNPPGPGSGLRLAGFGILWFFVTLSVESGFVPLADVIFEHRLYLPSIGATTAVAVLVVLAAEKITSRLSVKLLFSTVVLVLIFLTIATWQRNQIWQSEASLWGDTVKKSPNKARPWYNLGTYQLGEGSFEGALVSFNKAVKINSEYAEAWHNIGLTFMMYGQYKRAIIPLRRAVRLKPEMTDAEVNLAVALIYTQQHSLAIRHLKKIVMKYPERSDVRYNLGMAYIGTGQLALARDEQTALQRFDPPTALLLANEINKVSSSL